MDTLRAMRIFIRTFELGSLSAAARELHSTQPTVSKTLAHLERQLKVRLLERGTRGLSPTEQGQRFYRNAKAIVEQFDAAVGDLQGMTGQAAGFLRINAPVGLGQYRVNAMVQQFMAEQPAIDVELILSDRFADLVEEGIDIAFRLGGPLPPGAIGRHLATVPRFLAASPAYLERRGMPATPAGLAEHDVVRFAWTPGNTLDLFREEEQLRVSVSSRFRVNNALAIREALLLGGGLGVCPEWLIADLLDSGKLVRVLPEWGAGCQELYLLYPSRHHQPLRTKLFIDFVAGQFASLRGFEAPRLRQRQ